MTIPDDPGESLRLPRINEAQPAGDADSNGGTTWLNSAAPLSATESVPPPLPLPKRNGGQGGQGGQGNTVRIGLWGSPRSGKTTVISALPIAAMQGANKSGNWVVSGVGDIATSILTSGVNRLLKERRFPDASEAITPIMWSFQGRDDGVDVVGASSRFSRLKRPKSPSGLIDFALELQDVKGEYYNNNLVDPRVVATLAASNGLMYLFDPVLDSQEELRSFNYFYAVLQQVTSRVRDEGRMVDGRLPHHVAVLITKFDDSSFFESAVRADWVNQDPSPARTPYVPVEQGSAFFDWVCRSRQGGSAELVRSALQNFFHPGRVEYFACSAIGFKLNPNGVFDYSDYSNVQMEDGVPRIRSLVRPVNVIEPLIRLERRIARERVPAR